MNDVRRQFRSARNLLLIILPIGILGIMLIERMPFVDAAWFLIITLTTIGYGDVVVQTALGKVFIICLVLVGLGSLTFFLSSSFALLFSVENVARRRRALTAKKIAKLNGQYIICGSGEMVDKTIGYVLHSAQIRRKQNQDAAFRPIERLFERLVGPAERGRLLGLRQFFRDILVFYIDHFAEHITLLDLMVVVTEDIEYAEYLRSAGILVVEGEPTDDDSLLDAGIARARAIMVMLNQDAEGLLTVLTARNLNPTLYITAAAIDVELKQKMVRAGANFVIAPYELASQFLNSATLRPAVNDFFYSILFDQHTKHQMTQLELGDNSPWIGRRIGDLDLRRRFDASILGIRTKDVEFAHTPGSDRILKEGDIILGVAPGLMIPKLQRESLPSGRDFTRFATFQRLEMTRAVTRLDETLSLDESAAAIESMSKHFVICGNDHIIETAARFLNPARPFVLLSDSQALTREWLGRGFRVVLGNPASEEVLKRTGIDRAQALMLSIDDKAAAVLTVLSARSISKSLLISATAGTDDMIEKLQRSGADRVLSPFHVAGQFVLLSTTRPEITEFIQHMVYNEATRMETAEFYMEDDSPWIGKSIGSLLLKARYNAGVIGIRQADGSSFVYVPPMKRVIQPNEVLIVITPMDYFDEMRAEAAGGINKRPATLRTKTDLQASGAWSRDVIQELINQQEGS